MSETAETKIQVAPQTTDTANIVPGLANVQGFELAQRVGKLLSQSTLVPKEYQGNLPNCVIALNMALRMNADPLMVMQNLYIVNGKPGWSSQFLISTFNTCGKFSALRYEWVGEKGKDSWGCRAWAIEKATGEKLIGAIVTIETAKKEGWYTRNGSKWQTMPEQMLMYRAAAWFIRAYAPEIAMGMYTAEEIYDTVDLGPDDYKVMVEESADAEILDIDTEASEESEKPANDERQAEVEKTCDRSKPEGARRPKQAPLEGPGF